MSIDTNKSVGAITAEVPGAATVFESAGIDYCCGGQASIKDACAHAGVELDDLLAQIEGAAQAAGADQDAIEWTGKPLTELAEHIVATHHDFTRRELERLAGLAEKVAGAHGNNHPELMEINGILTELTQELVTHMLKEEQVLFPYIERMEQAVSQGRPIPQPFFGTVRNPVRMMMLEHDGAAEALRKVRELSSDFALPPEACSSFSAFYNAIEDLERDLHQHIHLENNILFPRAIEMEVRQ